MQFVERTKAAWELFEQRRDSVGWKGALALRTLDKQITTNAVGPEWPTVTINPEGSRFDLLMRTGPSSDFLVVQQVFRDRNYAVIDGLQDVHTIIDCGANAGYTSAYLLSSYPDARVIAVEPDPGNCQMCGRNLRSFGKRATIVQAAVWGSEKRLAMTRDRDDREWGREMKEISSADAEMVTGITMHHLIEQCGGKADIVKMDVEWAEKDIFAADTSWLASVRNLVIELHDEECKRVFFEAMQHWSFDLKFDNELTVCLNIAAKEQKARARAAGQ